MAFKGPSGGRGGVDIYVTLFDKSILIGGMVHALAASQARRAAYAAKQEAQRLVPRVSGALHDSIEVLKHEVGEYELVAGGGEVDYAAAVEFGTYKMSARPFFTPAMEHGRQIMLAAPEKKL